MKTSRIIQEATNILINNTWIQNNLSLDKKGNRVFPDDKKACQFDIMGALWLAGGKKTFPKDAGDLVGGMCHDTNYWSSYYIVSFNDALETTKEKVIQLLDTAYILALELEGQVVDDWV